MKKKKLIRFSDRQLEKIQKEAEEKQITFTDMLRRLIDHYFEQKEFEIKQKEQNKESHF